MAMAGIEVSPDAKAMFDSIKNHRTKKWAFFEIDRSKKVVPTQSGEGRDITKREEDKKIFEGEVKAKLRDDQPLMPDNAPMRDQMPYSSNKDAVKKAFFGIAGEFQFRNIGDIDYDTLAAAVEKK
uniref:ADF-H domain-containing protein n=1 Tax=Amphimedon queenslandica TaxID=400682 RepID=A0A1X7TVX3_AMPQE